MTERRPPLLELKNLCVSYPVRAGILGLRTSRFRAVDGVSLTIAAGETLGLVGESGCGKSSLARAVAGIEAVESGEILLEGKRLESRRSPEIQREVQIVFQDPFSALNPRMMILDIITEAAVLHGMTSRQKRLEFATNLLADVGLEKDILYRYPHAFSGGQRQRICIARALSLNPKLLICDEPVSALDVSVQAQVINLLLDLQDSRNLALLLISHDLSVVQHLAHRIAVLYAGQLVETGTTDEIMQSPAHPYTRLLLSSVRRIGEAPPELEKTTVIPEEQNETGCRFYSRCPIRTEQCLQESPVLRRKGESETHKFACFLNH